MSTSLLELAHAIRPIRGFKKRAGVAESVGHSINPGIQHMMAALGMKGAPPSDALTGTTALGALAGGAGGGLLSLLAPGGESAEGESYIRRKSMLRNILLGALAGGGGTAAVQSGALDRFLTPSDPGPMSGPVGMPDKPRSLDASMMSDMTPKMACTQYDVALIAISLASEMTKSASTLDRMMNWWKAKLMSQDPGDQAMARAIGGGVIGGGGGLVHGLFTGHPIRNALIGAGVGAAGLSGIPWLVQHLRKQKAPMGAPSPRFSVSPQPAPSLPSDIDLQQQPSLSTLTANKSAPGLDAFNQMRGPGNKPMPTTAVPMEAQPTMRSTLP